MRLVLSGIALGRNVIEHGLKIGEPLLCQLGSAVLRFHFRVKMLGKLGVVD